MMKERGRIELLWRTEKYRVLWYSHRTYDEIRERLKGDPSYKEIEKLIIQALKYEPKKNNIINSADHMWGYFKNEATSDEKKHYKKLKQEFKSGTRPASDLRDYLRELAQRYESEYLLESPILQ